ncbi:MAG: hypothetical protein R3B93_10900 [Bacteroidia bacterium]
MYSLTNDNNKSIIASESMISSEMISPVMMPQEEKTEESVISAKYQKIITIACLSFFPLVYFIGKSVVSLLG